jgi:ABC-type dipeptide/oligopeptide/nickel transport system permease subunit
MLRIAIILFFAFLLAGPLIAPQDPMLTDPANQLQPPSQAHLLGTDLLGRDVLSRALYGGQRTLLIAGLATIIALVPGIVIGIISGLSSPLLDSGIQVFVSATLAFPALMLALVVLTLIGAGAFPLALASGVAQIALCARITRASVLEVRSQMYIQAAKSLGATPVRLIVYHVLPNIRLPLFAYAVVVFSFCVLNAAALSFLGLGGDLSVPDWGVMLADGRTAFRSAPWIGLAPGLGITITVLMLNSLAHDITRRK